MLVDCPNRKGVRGSVLQPGDRARSPGLARRRRRDRRVRAHFVRRDRLAVRGWSGEPPGGRAVAADRGTGIPSRLRHLVWNVAHRERYCAVDATIRVFCRILNRVHDLDDAALQGGVRLDPNGIRRVRDGGRFSRVLHPGIHDREFLTRRLVRVGIVDQRIRHGSRVTALRLERIRYGYGQGSGRPDHSHIDGARHFELVPAQGDAESYFGTFWGVARHGHRQLGAVQVRLEPGARPGDVRVRHLAQDLWVRMARRRTQIERRQLANLNLGVRCRELRRGIAELRVADDYVEPQIRREPFRVVLRRAIGDREVDRGGATVVSWRGEAQGVFVEQNRLPVALNPADRLLIGNPGIAAGRHNQDVGEIPLPGLVHADVLHRKAGVNLRRIVEIVRHRSRNQNKRHRAQIVSLVGDAIRNRLAGLPRCDRYLPVALEQLG